MPPKLNNIGIISVGSGLGERVQSNTELAGIVKNYDEIRSGKPLDEWIRGRFGVVNRVKTSRLPSDLAADAVEDALDQSGLAPSDIDFLVLNTATGDYRQPTTATEVQSKAGMRPNSFAFEINMPCAGILYGMAVAKSMIEAGFGRHALVVGVDKMTDLVDPDDFIMSGMFGDGAGACIIGPDAAFPLMDIELGSQADTELSLCIPAGGSVHPTTEKTAAEKMHYLRMRGKPTSEFIKSSISSTIQTLMQRNHITHDMVEQIIPHQASHSIVMDTLRSVGFDEEKVTFSMREYGNTSAGSILITLQKYLNNRTTAPGYILMVGMGGGLNWGGALIQAKQG